VADLPFDLEEGDRVWATGLLPEVQYIQATSTISQWLAESFSKHTEPKPTLLTGGMGSHGSIPDYVKMFGQVFSEEGFSKLPNRKPWDHAIELTPGAQPKGCKVYPLLLKEQAELNVFLTENLETSALRSGLKTGKKPDQDQTKTDLFKDCSPVFSNFEIKDPKRPVSKPVETGLDQSFVPLNYLFKSSPIPCKMTQNLLRYSKFHQKQVTNPIVD
jgi:hypothetical protein